MWLDLRGVIDQPGASAPFSYRLSLPDMAFPFGRPFAEPIEAVGGVTNTAGMLVLSATLTSTLHLTCDRCAEPYRAPLALPVEAVLAETVEGPSDDEILLIREDGIDLDEALIPALILSMDAKHLCREDCRGLCPQCGRNLNEGPCACPPGDIDPRLAALKAFFT
ncbi:MAG: DUF177 domain-containing protein [Oscillospiraceae bacterium]|jgi:uncharacterized protein|nr:DUF177 domain-containing protein [Oscillospiraceae bacterium]